MQTGYSKLVLWGAGAGVTIVRGSLLVALFKKISERIKQEKAAA